MTALVLDNRVRVLVDDDEELGAHLRSRFTHDNPKREALRHMGVPGWWAEPKQIETWRNDGDGWLSLPRGGYAKVRTELAALGRRWRVEDRRCSGPAVDLPHHDLALYPYQEIAVQALLAKENCLLRAPTGSGKSSICMSASSRAGLATLVVVPNRVLLEQWVERARRELGLAKSEIGEVRSGQCAMRPFMVGIQKSVAIHAVQREFREHFGMVIADEVALFGAKTFFDSLDPFPARYRIGASADYRRKDKKEFLIRDLFGDVAVDIGHKDLVASGHVLDVEVRVIPTDFSADWYGVADKNDAEDDREVDFTRLVSEMSADGARNRLAINAARELVTEGEQVVVFAHHREHCMTMAQAISEAGSSVGLLLGGPESLEEFRRAAEGLKTGKVRVGIGTYKAIGLGVDIPRLGAGVAVTPIAGNQQLFQQVRGRLCRTSTGKAGARLYYLLDVRVFPTHLKNLARWNASTTVLERATGRWVPVREWLKRVRAA